MIVIDDTVPLAILFSDEQGQQLFDVLAQHRLVTISATAHMRAVSRLAEACQQDISFAWSSLEDLYQALGIWISDVSPTVAHEAMIAYGRYGQKSGHPAQLDLIGCTTYALARLHRGMAVSTHPGYRNTDLIVPDGRSSATSIYAPR